MKASDAIKIENRAPSVDYTYGNGSGHYALLPNSKILYRGRVGYLHLQKDFRITSEESYCLNFEYYDYGLSYVANLKVYLWISDEFEIIQMLWPRQSCSQYT